MKIKKELSKSNKSSQNYECLKLWHFGSWPSDRRSGANALVTSAGEAGFLHVAFEAIVCSAGFHLRFLAFKILWSLIPATEIIETSKKWHQTIHMRIIRLSPRSLTICSFPENSIKDIEVTPTKSEQSKVCQNMSGLTCFIYLWTSGRQRVVKTRWKGTGKAKSCSEWW